MARSLPARRERDRVCPSLLPRLPDWPNEDGEFRHRREICAQATKCAIFLTAKALTPFHN